MEAIRMFVVNHWLLLLVLGYAYLFIGARIAKVYERLYPKVNRDELVTLKEQFIAFLLMPFLFFTDSREMMFQKWNHETPWEALGVTRFNYYGCVALFWFPAIVCQVIITFPYLLFHELIRKMMSDGPDAALSPEKKPEPILTTAQQLARVEARLEADGKLASELRQQLVKEQGPLGGHRGKPAEVLACRDDEVEREAEVGYKDPAHLSRRRNC